MDLYKLAIFKEKVDGKIKDHRRMQNDTWF